MRTAQVVTNYEPQVDNITLHRPHHLRRRPHQTPLLRQDKEKQLPLTRQDGELVRTLQAKLIF